MRPDGSEPLLCSHCNRLPAIPNYGICAECDRKADREQAELFRRHLNQRRNAGAA